MNDDLTAPPSSHFTQGISFDHHHFSLFFIHFVGLLLIVLVSVVSSMEIDSPSTHDQLDSSIRSNNVNDPSYLGSKVASLSISTLTNHIGYTGCQVCSRGWEIYGCWISEWCNQGNVIATHSINPLVRKVYWRWNNSSTPINNRWYFNSGRINSRYFIPCMSWHNPSSIANASLSYSILPIRSTSMMNH